MKLSVDGTNSLWRENDSSSLNDKFDNASPVAPADIIELRQTPFATTKNPLDP